MATCYITELKVDSRFSERQINRYKRAGYRLIGRNSAIEICRWTKTSLKGKGNCYKRWYGISSHRCIQMTPNLNFCNYACDFCWRIHEEGRYKVSNILWDEPKEIIERMREEQRKLLSGFKGNPDTKQEALLEALFPRHVAISLDGEPTMYPKLVDFIREIKAKGMTAFLVTNGSLPYRLKELLDGNAEPTNLYVSVYGPNREIFLKTAKPKIPNAWENLMESLKLLNRFNCRTIFRMTLVKGLNMLLPEGYAELIKMSNPKFVELKGYTWVGESIMRLEPKAMPSMEEIEYFADKIAEYTSYIIKARDEKSRVVVMVKDEDTWRWNLEQIKEQKEKEKEFDRLWKGKVKEFKTKLNIFKSLG
ncbi:MAG: 4-demethylwyosine synthase TYW1 [Nitrososphaerales archaeon]